MRAVLFLAMLAATALPATADAAPTSAEKAAAKRISSHIQQSGQLRNYRIGVTYKNGVATLAGTVASTDQRETAIRLAEQVKGVQKVECQLECPDVAKNSDEGVEQAGIEEAAEESKPEFGLVAGPGADEPANQPNIRQAAAQNQQQAPSNIRQAAAQKQQQQAPFARNGFNRPIQQRPRMMPRRSNMPLPQRRFVQDPSVRQTSGVYPAGGCYGCENGGAPMMGGMGGYGGAGMQGGMMGGGQAVPAGFVSHGMARGPSYENAQMPGYAWPSYASYPNYAALTYPQQYSPTAWPYIGPFYPYPQVPLAWRKVSLEWDDGWWFLDFSAHNSSH
jgi:hypothetical protein